MSVEWIAQTDTMTCVNCRRTINGGEKVVGDFDRLFHGENEDCESQIE